MHLNKFSSETDFSNSRSISSESIIYLNRSSENIMNDAKIEKRIFQEKYLS